MKLYPLTAGQDVILIQQKFSVSKAVSNINMLLTFEFEFDLELMQQALFQALLRNRAARIRLRQTDEGPRQYFSQALPEGVEFIDLSALGASEAENMIEKWGQVKFPNKNFDTQLYRIKMLLLPSKEYAIYFCVSHLIFDAYALIAVTGDMLEIYRSIQAGEPLPKALPSPMPVYQKEWDFLASPAYEKSLAFFREYFSEEPEFQSFDGPDSPHYIKGKRYGTTLQLWRFRAGFIDLRIPARIVQGIEQLAYESQIPTQSYYILALRNYLSKLNQADDISYYHTVARRGTLAQKRSGGTMVNPVLFRMTFKNDLTALEALQEIALLQLKLYRHADVPFGVQAYILSKTHQVPKMKGYATIGMTYQPYSIFKFDDMPMRLKRYNNGYTAMGLYITIMSVDNTGDLLSNYEYLRGYTKEESIYNYHAYLLAMLDYLLEHPDATVQELVNVDPGPEHRQQ